MTNGRHLSTTQDPVNKRGMKFVQMLQSNKSYIQRMKQISSFKTKQKKMLDLYCLLQTALK
jgi:hypothetical protein